jgi:hypothetical protein
VVGAECIEEIVRSSVVAVLAQRLRETAPRSPFVLRVAFERGEALVHPGSGLLAVPENTVRERPKADFRMPLDECVRVSAVQEELFDRHDSRRDVRCLPHQPLARPISVGLVDLAVRRPVDGRPRGVPARCREHGRRPGSQDLPGQVVAAPGEFPSCLHAPVRRLTGPTEADRHVHDDPVGSFAVAPPEFLDRVEHRGFRSTGLGIADRDPRARIPVDADGVPRTRCHTVYCRPWRQKSSERRRTGTGTPGRSRENPQNCAPSARATTRRPSRAKREFRWP